MTTRILLWLVSVMCSVGLRGQSGSLSEFFAGADSFFASYVDQGMVNYSDPGIRKDLVPLGDFIADFDYRTLGGDTAKAYLINAYNLMVVKEVLDEFPIASVLKVYGFFDRQTNPLGGKEVTLDGLEKDILLTQFPDPRIHFALSCASLGCPRLLERAYLPQTLGGQLDDQTRTALSDSAFLHYDPENERLHLSRIFDWYAEDFGGSRDEVLAFVNRYRGEEVPQSVSFSYYAYDWALNLPGGALDATNVSRYVVSSTIPAGEVEVKWFNNLYSQQTTPSSQNGEVRESYFTSILSAVYGVSSTFNVGFDLRYRRVSVHDAPASPFKVFSLEDATGGRAVVSTLGPKIRWAPHPRWTNFSVQSALWIPLRDDLTDSPWIDWDGPSWFTQVFNDFDIGSKYALFAELDFFIEDMGKKEEGRLNRFSTPVTGIFSYFPTSKSTIYTLVNFSPYWAPELDYFFQPGLGAKYQITSRWEVELLYTYFTNSFLVEAQGRALTLNLGIRYSSW